MKKKTFFVTGCFGLIGLSWCKFLLAKNYSVIGIDIKDNNPDIKRHKNFKFYKKSVFDYKFIENIIKKSDYVFHFAAIASPDQYVRNPIKVMDLTALAAIAISKFCSKHNSMLFFTSTSEIYGKNDSIPFSESSNRVLGSTDIDRWCYSSSKALVEHYIKALSKNNKLNYVIFRLFNVYGPNIEGRVIDKFIKNALVDKDILIYGNGKQIRCFLYIDDCMKAFYEIFKKKKLYNNTYNIGNNTKTSMIDLAKIVKHTSKSKSKIKFIKVSAIHQKGFEDINTRIPDIKLLKKSILWKPKINLIEGIEKTIKSFSK
jgi:nucleoside-diphosphate-sugar epimerase